MENDERILFQVTDYDDQVSVQCNFKGVKDMATVCTCIATLAEEKPDFGLMLALTMKTLHDHPELQEEMMASKEQMPDFNQLLKNIKDNG